MGRVPPGTNEISPHHFSFTVYALSVKTLGLGADFDGPAALAALKDKVLAEGKFVALYSTNPAKGRKCRRCSNGKYCIDGRRDECPGGIFVGR